jgi:hypothetical protein
MAMNADGVNVNTLAMAQMNNLSTNMSVIVFPYDRLTKDFSKRNYNRLLTDSKFSEQDVDRVLNKIKASPHFKPKNCLWVFMLMPLLMFAMVGIFVWVIISGVSSSRDDDSDDGDGPDVTLIILAPMLLMVGMFVLIFTIVCCVAKRSAENLRLRKADFDRIVKEENANFFSAREVRWTVGPHASSLSIHLDYMARGRG